MSAVIERRVSELAYPGVAPERLVKEAGRKSSLNGLNPDDSRHDERP